MRQPSRLRLDCGRRSRGRLHQILWREHPTKEKDAPLNREKGDIERLSNILRVENRSGRNVWECEENAAFNPGAMLQSERLLLARPEENDAHDEAQTSIDVRLLSGMNAAPVRRSNPDRAPPTAPSAPTAPNT